ncbi:MAG: VWA domain-containing protein [Chloroflexi bacterium]|nr:VWA domain-containing protein [Chloroflexota bacterium]
MTTYRYFKWDGSQDLYQPVADELMRDLERNLMSYGDLSHALRLMQRGGLRDKQGRRLSSMQELTQRLRQKRQEQLDKYDLGSVLDDIRKKLDDIVAAERGGIQRRLDEARQKAAEISEDLTPAMRQKLLKTMEERAEQNSQVLDGLPSDLGGRVKELAGYDFIDPSARQQFQELMDMLKKNALESHGRDLVQRLQKMDQNSLAGLRNFVEALNQMLEQRLKGQEPDFNGFMSQFGQYFGNEPPQNIDDLIERLQSQLGQAQSLLSSMSTKDRETLENLLDSMLDEATRMEMAKLAANLKNLYPGDKLRRQYSFSGEESLSYTEALELMESLQKMDQLENKLKESQYSRSIDTIDENLLQEIMGDEAAEELDRLRSITRVLEEAGYIRWKDGKYELTPRGMRKIGQKALADIFAQLRRDRLGGHSLNLKGSGGERIEETKRLEFGDDFEIHLQRTIMNALKREATSPPVKLEVDDFEVYCEEAMTRSATVLMLDLSLSMPMRGNFEAAKRVAVALDSLIRTQYPRDCLHIIGFSSYARRIKKDDLTCMSWDEFDPYTNIQHGLYVARRILSRERSTNKQIIMISDGEPTAHLEGGNIFFQYPPSLRTLQLTLREVRTCTQKGIIINTFMLESGRFLGAFVTQMARINKGRVFFTSADSLGQYLLVDYISHKRRKL